MALILFDLDETVVVKYRSMKVAGFDETDEYDLEDKAKLERIHTLPYRETINSENTNFAEVEYVLEGIIEVLEKLQAQGHRLGVVTSRQHTDNFFPDGLSVLKKYFTVALGRDDEAHSLDDEQDVKPAHEILRQQGIDYLDAAKAPLIRKIMREQGFTAAQTIYVGDAISDYGGALFAGIGTFIEAKYYTTFENRLESSDNLRVASVHNPAEILDVVAAVEQCNTLALMQDVKNNKGGKIS